MKRVDIREHTKKYNELAKKAGVEPTQTKT